MNNNVFIYAYTELNLGDDLFTKVLCDRYPKSRFTVVAKKQCNKPFKAIENLQTISAIPLIDGLFSRLNTSLRINLLLSRYLSRKKDVIVRIGGSIFMESTKWRQDIGRFEKSIIPDKPYFVLGSNFGPYTSDDFYHQYKNIFSGITDLSFRDQNSYNLFANLSNVRIAPDVIFSMDISQYQFDEPLNAIVISVIDLTQRADLKRYTRDYENKINQMIDNLVEHGYTVKLISFCESEGDLSAINRISQKIPASYQSSVLVYNYDGNIDEAIMFFRNSKGVVATRFHSMILSWLFKIPVYPLIYSNKTHNVIQDSGFQESYTWIKDINDLDVQSVINQLSSGYTMDASIQIEEAHKHFAVLDNVL